MNIPHEILTDAIEFALLDQKVKRMIKKRDQHPGVGVREIRVKIVDPDPKKDFLKISIGFNYIRKNQDIPDGEDILINLVFHREKGYKIV